MEEEIAHACGTYAKSVLGGGIVARMDRFLLIKEFLMFLKERKKFWLIPIVVVFLAVGMLLVAAQGSVVAPFIYTLF